MQTHELLQKYLKKKKLSLRAVAAHLEISASFLSRVMSGQKPVPYPLLLKLIKALDIEAEVATSLKKSHSVEVAESASPLKGKAEVEIPLSSWDLAKKNDFNILRQWFYLAILDVTTLKDFDGTIEAIAAKLGLHPQTTEVAVRELTDKGMLEIVDGKIKKIHRKIRWGSGQSIADVRKFHGQMLDKAKQQLEEATTPEEFSRRLIMGITVTASHDKIEHAKKRLNDSLYEIANELMQDQGDEVYHLAGQFFPLTKRRP